MGPRTLARVRVRSVEAVSLVHAVTESLAVSTKRDMAILLTRIARASDSSLLAVRRGTVLHELTRRFVKTRDESLRSALLELFAELARYDMGADELSHVLDLVT